MEPKAEVVVKSPNPTLATPTTPLSADKTYPDTPIASITLLSSVEK
jgi:hypothetical protein